MDQIIDALYKISEKTWVDYVLIGAPIVLSIVAIWISIQTAIKQNKIALFELRYNCVSQIRTLISFKNSVRKCKSPLLVLCLFDAFWGASVSNMAMDDCVINARCKVEIIKKDIISAQYLFDHDFTVNLVDLASCFQKVIISAAYKEFKDEYVENLCDICDKLAQKDLPQMIKKIKM